MNDIRIKDESWALWPTEISRRCKENGCQLFYHERDHYFFVTKKNESDNDIELFRSESIDRVNDFIKELASKYVEPYGFHGTKGRFIVEKHDPNVSKQYFGNIVSELGRDERGIMSIRTIDVLLKYASEDEMEANAKLFANSKEIAKALQESTNTIFDCLMRDERITMLLASDQRNHDMMKRMAATVEKSNKILKEAGL